MFTIGKPKWWDYVLKDEQRKVIGFKENTPEEYKEDYRKYIKIYDEVMNGDLD